MGRDPRSVCREYLRASDTATRCHAVAALEAIAGEAIAGELAHLALTDGDEKVRRRADEAISRLPEGSRAHALEALHAALGDRGTRLRAHALLTKLRNQGFAVGGKRRPLSERLRLASEVRGAVEQERASSYLGAFQWSVGFALLGALLVSFLIAVKVPAASPAVIASVATVALVLSPLLACAAAGAALPDESYLDRGAAWCVEIVASGAAALPVYSAVGVLMLLIWPSLSETPGLTVAALGLGILAYGWLFIGAIRTATMSCAVLCRKSWWSRILGALAGWGAGMAAATAAIFMVEKLARWQLKEEAATLAAGFWLLALPAAAAVAAAFARLEKSVEPRRKSSRALMSAPAISGAVLLLVGWFWVYWPQQGPRTFEADSYEPLNQTLTFDRAPAVIRFEVGFRQKVFARLAAKQDTSGAVLRLSRVDPPKDYPPPDQPLILTELERGAYRLKAEIFPLSWADEPFGVARRLAHLDLAVDSYAIGARRVEPFDLELTLNSDPEFADSARIPELLHNGRLHEAFDSFDRVVRQRPELARSVGFLDRLCRTSSLWKLREAWGFGSPEAAEVNAERIAGTCDEAVALADGNGAVHDSRALARMLTGDAAGAVEDLEVFVAWTAEESESLRRRRWIAALKESSGDTRKVPVPADLRMLLDKSANRDIVGWTRATAQEHVSRGAKILKTELAKLVELPRQPVDTGQLAEGFRSFDQAAIMIPELGDDPVYWRYVCRLGALFGPPHAVAASKACDAAVRLAGESAEALLGRAVVRAASGDFEQAVADLEALPEGRIREPWIRALREGGPLPLDDLEAMRRRAVESWPTPPLIGGVLDAAPGERAPGRSGP